MKTQIRYNFDDFCPFVSICIAIHNAAIAIRQHDSHFTTQNETHSNKYDNHHPDDSNNDRKNTKKNTHTANTNEHYSASITDKTHILQCQVMNLFHVVLSQFLWKDILHSGWPVFALLSHWAGTVFSFSHCFKF